MEEIKVKTHLIITDIQDEYEIKWCGKIVDIKPELKNGKPIFVIIGSNSRTELNTVDMARIENTAKLLTSPKGRAAITADISRIFIKEVNGNEHLLGIVTHKKTKHYAPMYDSVGYK